MGKKILPANISNTAKHIFHNTLNKSEKDKWSDEVTGRIISVPGSLEEFKQRYPAERILSGIEDDRDWLGCYGGMQSPGIITFDVERLIGFTWSLIDDLIGEGLIINLKDIENLFQYCVAKTWHHELFHHFTDVQSFLSAGFQKDRFLEEALAVAYSHLKITSKELPVLTQRFLSLAYDYRAPGYRDWVQYQTQESFQTKLIEYLNYPGGSSLVQRGYPLHSLLIDQLNSVVKFRYIGVHWQ